MWKYVWMCVKECGKGCVGMCGVGMCGVGMCGVWMCGCRCVDV